jgi:hypothetical protein
MKKQGLNIKKLDYNIMRTDKNVKTVFYSLFVIGVILGWIFYLFRKDLNTSLILFSISLIFFMGWVFLKLKND